MYLCLGALIFHCWRCPPLYWCHFFFSISFQLLKLNLLCFAAPSCIGAPIFHSPQRHQPIRRARQPATFNFFFKIYLFWGRYGKKGCKRHTLPPRLEIWLSGPPWYGDQRDFGSQSSFGSILKALIKNMFIKRKAWVFTMIIQHWKKKTWFDLMPNMIYAFLLKNV